MMDVPQHSRLRVHWVLGFVQLTFGALHVLGRHALGRIPPMPLAGLRVLGAAPLLMAGAWRLDRIRPSRSDLPRLALLGFLGVFTNQLAFIQGLYLTSASNAAILMPSIPVFAQGFALALGVEQASAGILGGVALAATGAWVMLGSAGLSGSSALWGNLLLLVNCISYALYLVLQKPLLRRLPPLTVVAWAYLFGGAGVLAVTLPGLLHFPLNTVPAVAWAEIVYIILIPSSLNYVLNAWAIKKTTPTLAAAYIMLQPLVGVILAAAWLGERLGWSQGLGFVLIASGLALVSHGVKSQKPPDQSRPAEG